MEIFHKVLYIWQVFTCFLIELGQYEIVKILVEKGADINSSDIFHNTPLSFAVSGGNFGHFQ